MFQSIDFNAKPRAVTNVSKPEVLEKLKRIVAAEKVLVESEKVELFGADGVKEKLPPEAPVFSGTTPEILRNLKKKKGYLKTKPLFGELKVARSQKITKESGYRS